MTTTGKNRIMIFGPKTDGTYVVECRGCSIGHGGCTIIMEHSDVLFDIHNEKNDARRMQNEDAPFFCKGGEHEAVTARHFNSTLSTGVGVRANPAHARQLCGHRLDRRPYWDA
jgi:hypothetical protein